MSLNAATVRNKASIGTGGAEALAAEQKFLRNFGKYLTDEPYINIPKHEKVAHLAILICN